MRSQISIVVAEDHPLMLKSIVAELEQLGYNVIGKANNGAQALELITELKPVIAFLDVELPHLNAYEIVSKSRAVNSITKYIFITYHKESGFLVQAKNMQIEGYLLKEDALDKIDTCILQVSKGHNYYSPTQQEAIKTSIAKELQDINQLSPSERTIIRLISQHKSSQNIAEILSISQRTVQKHRTNIIKKLNLSGTSNPIETWIAEHLQIVKNL